jgi:hypothetical protein
MFSLQARLSHSTNGAIGTKVNFGGYQDQTLWEAFSKFRVGIIAATASLCATAAPPL